MVFFLMFLPYHIHVDFYSWFEVGWWEQAQNWWIDKSTFLHAKAFCAIGDTNWKWFWTSGVPGWIWKLQWKESACSPVQELELWSVQKIFNSVVSLSNHFPVAMSNATIPLTRSPELAKSTRLVDGPKEYKSNAHLILVVLVEMTHLP